MTIKRLKNIAALLMLVLLIAAVTGCDSDSDSTAPETNAQEAPVLPDAGKLTLDVSFFDAGADMTADMAGKDFTKTNFLNAYLRVAVLNIVTRVVLTPPVAAFAVALHTVPSYQEDGSWIWVYTHVDGAEEQQIRLRGLPVTNGVEWQMHVSDSAANPPFENELWFEGSTHLDGQLGDWTFYDFNLTGKPAVARLEWGTDSGGEYLVISALYGADEGDVLAYRHDAPDCSIDFTDGADGSQYYIRWNEFDGTGSLMVPDYNNGDPACWDENQDDTDCR